MNLFQIDEMLLSCAIDTETGEIIDAELLEQLEMEREKKIESIACWIKNLNAEAEALKVQKQTFADRQKVAENKAESLKKYLSDYLDGQKFKTDKVAISFRKTTSVDVHDLEAVPDEYIKIKKEPDKTAIKNDLKCGVIVPGAELVNGRSMTIK